MPTSTRLPTRRRRLNPTDWFGYSVADEIKAIITHTPLTKVRDVSEDQPFKAFKPSGLWYACGGAWITWMQRSVPEWIEDGQYLYEVFPKYSAVGLQNFSYGEYAGGVLRLETEEEVDLFDSLFGEDFGNYVNWFSVAQIWDGIEICPYQDNLRFSAIQWYYPWDVASGCIWRPEGLMSTSLLKSRTSASTAPRRGVDTELAQAHGRANPRRRNPLPSREEITAARNRFYDALEAEAGEGQTYYFGPFVVIGDQKGGVLGKLELNVWQGMPNGGLAVSLSYIGVNKDERQRGQGARLMQIVLAAADAAGLPVTLTVSPQKEYGEKKPPMNKKDLRAFYEKFGFRTDRARGIDAMVRDVPPRANPRRR